MNTAFLRSSGTVPGCVLRPLQPSDLPAVLRLQARAYPPAYHERAEVFATRLALAPGGCWIAERGGEAAGYVIAHPWQDAQPPDLHAPLSMSSAPQGDIAFLHDMAVCPQARGIGLAQGLFRKVRAWAICQELSAIVLVSLPDARAFWQRLGFVDHARTVSAGYGAGACCMRLALSAK
ncbi:GNAT family N-acetyltransferase [Pseudothauera hydrothermalis]|uniref:GNAT family N-acetyltransferase n=1 Tax=Pseudothauera hydrothermalis TaxID=2184083 RepID=UPI001F20D40C|nr:GNAT family N-acetyltransferase [Pseudothauera hydrothermalis]